MSSKRLAQLEKNIARLHEQLANKEDALVTIEPAEKTRIKQQIEDLKRDIAEQDREYWEVFNDIVEDVTVTEAEAEPIMAEVIASVGQLAAATNPPVSEPMLALLLEIRDKLNEPGTTASAKLKGMISTMPPFVGLTYEAELDTEQVLRKYFPNFRRWVKQAVKKS
jgi:hypothetical protein